MYFVFAANFDNYSVYSFICAVENSLNSVIFADDLLKYQVTAKKYHRFVFDSKHLYRSGTIKADFQFLLQAPLQVPDN
jgi:hypothetical protein